MSYNLGTAEGVITTSYNGKGVDAANKDVDKLTKGHGEASAAIDKVGRTSGAAGLAIAAGIGLAVNAAANFEQRMSAVKAVSGASASEMDALSKKALQLGKDTQFSATDAASAIEELVKAGVSVPDVMNGAADATVALAAAGELSLPKAATIASNAMNQFQLSAKDMPKVADLIAGAANASAIDVEEFGMSMSQAGAVAHLVGASFDDTAAAIALMGNAGIKGSDAGTSLKTMLSNLQPQTKKQATLMKDLGIITKDGANRFLDAKGNLKSFADISQILQDSLKGATAAQKQQALSTIFGSDAIRAAAIFTQAGAKGFNEMSASMNKVKAADVAKTRMDNLKGSLEQFKGSVETAGIVVGQIFLPMLRNIVDFLAKVANAFLNLPAGVQKAIAIFVAVVGAILLFIAATVKIVKAVQTIIEVAKVLRVVMASTWAATLGPIALIIAAIALVVVAIILLWKKSETFRKIVLGVWAAIKTAIKAVVGWITGSMVPGLVAAWNAVGSALSAAKDFIVGVWNAIVNAIKTAISAVGSALTTGFNGVTGFFTGLWNGLVGIVTGAWTAIVNAVKAGFALVVSVFTTIGEAILAPFRALWGVFGGIITATFNLIVQIIKLGVAVWVLVINTAMAAINAVVNAVWKAIVATITNYINLAKSVITTVWNFISSITTTVWNAIKSFFKTVWTAIVADITAKVNLVKSVVTAVWNAIKSAATTTWNAIKTATSAAWGLVRDYIINPMNTAYNKVVSVAGTIRTAIGGVWDKVKSKTTEIWNSLISVISGPLDKIYTKVTGIIGKIKDAFAGAGSWLYEAGKNIIRGLLNGIESLINSVTDKLKSLTDKIPKVKGPERVDKALLKPAGKWIMEGFIGELDKGINRALSLLSNTTGMIPDTITARSVQDVMPATGLSRAAAVATAGTVPPAAGRTTTIKMDVYNPVGKPAAEELSEQATRLAVLGVL